MVLAIPSIEDWAGAKDEIAKYIISYNKLMNIDEEDNQTSEKKKGSHKKESYIAWIMANHSYGSKVSSGTIRAIYSPVSPLGN
jgi:hypothetical protein